jgi:hypothetical protein
MGLLILTLIANLWAVDPVTSAIDQAQSLALKKNRQEALKVLNQAISAAASPLRGRSKLIETQAAIGKVFFTDKGQRLFESGQSTMYENPDAALNQYKEALALEDNNILILDNIARVQLTKQDCTAALLTLSGARTFYPFAPEPAVLELRALLCQKNYEAFREKVKLLPVLEKGQESFVQFLSAQDFLQQKMWRKASDVLNRVSEEEPKFPETYYYLTKAGVELGRDTEGWALKYVSLCKGITLRERKKWSLEPMICSNAKEVEDGLAKKTDL